MMPNRYTDALLDATHYTGILAARIAISGIQWLATGIRRSLTDWRRNRRIHRCHRNWCRCDYADWYWNQFE